MRVATSSALLSDTSASLGMGGVPCGGQAKRRAREARRAAKAEERAARQAEAEARAQEEAAQREVERLHALGLKTDAELEQEQRLREVGGLLSASARRGRMGFASACPVCVFAHV